MHNLLDGLNPRQHAAVTLPHTSALILAGAGCGKTRVLTARIAWLLKNGKASSSQIFAVTFTNKAAKEMLTRLSALLPGMPHAIWVGTFHGLANRLLRSHHQEAGLPRLFQILDSADQLSAIKRLLKSLNADTDRFDAKKVQLFINQQKEQGLRAHHMAADDPWTRKMAEFYAAYDAQCARENVVDFAELLLRSHELLQHHPALREHYQQRFRHILIDEFQDTNRLQYRWLKQFAGSDTALMAVGDDDQSIYAFRGAHSGNMHEFQRDYAGDNLIRLEQNYRSQGNILDAANALISQNSGRMGKNLWTDAGAGEPLYLYAADNDQDEARFIADKAAHLQQQGHLFGEMAILYRSNAQSRILEHTLFSAGIPYRVYGGLRFFDRQEIRHAMAYLRLLVNPDDDNAFLRVVNFPTRGIGARTLELIDAEAQANGSSLWQVARHAAGKPGKGMASFVQLIEQLQTETELMSLPDTIAHILNASGLAAHYQQEKEGQDRLDNLQELINAASVFLQDNAESAVAPASGSVSESASGSASGSALADFLAHAALEAGHQNEQTNDAVQLMTVHAAKGLEFRTVFLSGLEEGLFPNEQALSESKGIEEERRLMYVAITRAREHLFLSYAHTRLLHGQTRYGIPSRFLSEIPASLMQSEKTKNNIYQSTKNEFSPKISTSGGSLSGTSRPDTGAFNTASANWRSGMNVRHPKFGLGVIMQLEGRGDDARAQVNFGAVHGVKWLALAYARLEPV